MPWWTRRSYRQLYVRTSICYRFNTWGRLVNLGARWVFRKYSQRLHAVGCYGREPEETVFFYFKNVLCQTPVYLSTTGRSQCKGTCHSHLPPKSKDSIVLPLKCHSPSHLPQNCLVGCENTAPCFLSFTVRLRRVYVTFHCDVNTRCTSIIIMTMIQVTRSGIFW
jgi:hypothetical protein